jgi:NADH:ubiquinone oxidoreductase subunit E
MKQDKLKVQDEEQDEKKNDYLLPILKKLQLEDKELDEEAAIHVKNEALKNLKERLLTRAEII